MSIGPCGDHLKDGLQATSLDGDEVVRLLDTCTRHHDHFNGFKVAAIVVLGTSIIQRHLVATVVPIIYTASMGFRGTW
jgi:hypothetical protein